MRAEELVFLGMVPPPKSKSQKNVPVHVAKKVEVRTLTPVIVTQCLEVQKSQEKRKLVQEQHEKEYLRVNRGNCTA